MKHKSIMDSDMGITLYGLNSGTNTAGYKAVKKAAVELTIEKMYGVPQSSKKSKRALKGVNKV